MAKTIIAIIFISLVSVLSFVTPSNAQTCPDYYRFVDFGLEDDSGVMYRGGTLLRAEGFSAEALLLENLTQCLKVRDLAKDGHGNPIPVVKSIHYIPEIISAELSELQVSRVKDTEVLADKNITKHSTYLRDPDTITTKGENYVCATVTTKKLLSCQLASPYPGNINLVVYCNAAKCDMPVFAINKELMISASWRTNDSLLRDPKKAGSQSVAKAQQIYDFLKPLSAAFN